MPRKLFLIFLMVWATEATAVEFAAPRRVDERRANRAGIRKVVGRHLRLYTDLPASDAVDSLPVVFDAAVPLWAEYFQIDPEKLRNWRMQGFLIEDRAKFAALGLLPQENPEFITGYSNGYELWLVDQPSDYYRRHLLLHEGTHGFMYTQLGDTGPGWYMEGMAELLGTHSWHEGRLSMRVMPATRQAVPMWGRIKLIRQAARDDKTLTLRQIMALDKRRAFSTAEYAWCWGLCHFLDSHPRWQNQFRQLSKHLGEHRFNEQVHEDFRDEWPELQTEWQAFLAALDYGYDTQRMTMAHRTSATVTDAKQFALAADRGWQSTGCLLESGKNYRITATGRYQIAAKEKPWPCEPGGVTLRYHEGRPLGMLIGAWRTDSNDRFSKPFSVGLSTTLKPTANAVLYLRVNDSSAQLSDNRGELSVSIRRRDD